MKIKTKRLPYEKVMALPRAKHRNPLKPLFLLQKPLQKEKEKKKAAEIPGEENYHDVAVVEGTQLFDLYGEETETNTRHHQGIGLVGEGLKVSAMWTEGFPLVMEAVEHKTLPIIGVQWHPERMYLHGNEEQQEAGRKLLEYWLGL